LEHARARFGEEDGIAYEGAKNMSWRLAGFNLRQGDQLDYSAALIRRVEEKGEFSPQTF